MNGENVLYVRALHGEMNVAVCMGRSKRITNNSESQKS